MLEERSMGNIMSKMQDCHHQINRRELKRELKIIAQGQVEVENRMKDCTKELDDIEDFLEKNPLPEPVSKALSRGQDELMEERYMLSSELFEFSQIIAETLIKMIDIDKEAAKCCKKLHYKLH